MEAKAFISACISQVTCGSGNELSSSVPAMMPSSFSALQLSMNDENGVDYTVSVPYRSDLVELKRSRKPVASGP